jgi:hypothetical protein
MKSPNAFPVLIRFGSVRVKIHRTKAEKNGKTYISFIIDYRSRMDNESKEALRVTKKPIRKRPGSPKNSPKEKSTSSS